MEIMYLNHLASFFSDQKGQKCWEHYCSSIPVYIKENSSKIKPISRNCRINHLYELKVKKGECYYRLAYYYNKEDQQIIVIYISTMLKKAKFEKELVNFLNKNYQNITQEAPLLSS